ncbi:hypothetical protein JDV02_007329 [Purpureocillium takamizusanense]|uniref:Uncharacterized protein n=1 Tax=Purpureocillium takamizusanense TaxID=2060973 RepID=A0A9Q8QKL5_9HYPO|nr:uncharacterized protein JDV02_007329 [Purpureocillium takamizusanense]UNI21330.1 hypothetical protein JDV02_007329 [Purpureocillium takamizusanense]
MRHVGTNGVNPYGVLSRRPLGWDGGGELAFSYTAHAARSLSAQGWLAGWLRVSVALLAANPRRENDTELALASGSRESVGCLGPRENNLSLRSSPSSRADVARAFAMRRQLRQ